MNVKYQDLPSDEIISKELAEGIVRNVPIPAILLDNTWKLIALNEYASEILKVTIAKAPDMRSEDVFGGALGGSGDNLLRAIKEGHTPAPDNISFTDEMGSCITFTVTSKPISGDNGEPIGVLPSEPHES